MISIKLFQNTEVQLNGKYKSIQFAVEKQAGGRVDDLSINPLTVAAKPAKMSKVKVRTPINRKPSPQSLDYPDDPKFRGKIDYPDNSDYPSSFRGEKPEEVNPAYSSL